MKKFLIAVAGWVAVTIGAPASAADVAGGQIGYRWQSFKWVFGLEAQGNWADFNGSNLSLVLAPLTNHSKVDAFGLLTGQLGYTANNLLFYMKGGAAVTRAEYNTFAPGAPGVIFNDARQTRWGGTLGVGLEFGFAPNWSVGAEYDHLFMGHFNASFATRAGLLPRIDRIGQDVDIGLVRVNYRWGGPAVVRY